MRFVNGWTQESNRRERISGDYKAGTGTRRGILHTWGRLEEALERHKKQEVIYLESGDEDGLQLTYGNQASILQDWGRLEKRWSCKKNRKPSATKLGNQDGLQRTYGNQAVILQDLGASGAKRWSCSRRRRSSAEELGNQDGLQRTYGNQALILQELGASGRSDGAAQEEGSHLPEAGQPGRAWRFATGVGGSWRGNSMTAKPKGESWSKRSPSLPNSRCPARSKMSRTAWTR